MPVWTAEVDATRMHVMALILGDPNVIHVDADAVRQLGLGEAPVNQGPVNIAYLLNMLREAFPGGRIMNLSTRLLANVFAGDRVTAGGVVTDVTGDGVVTCEVWLDRPGGRALHGTATVRTVISGDD
ncbi:MaoC family dehydratase [Streptomyces muensis]|uniref:MaoC family dehydratase n=1 Tax=Streptomyces muensis TaxID=1077944 RepID=UPI001F33221A|nr:MaoC/PaaZ C-terminal domain-containing protein [Streptomyces muensis]